MKLTTAQSLKQGDSVFRVEKGARGRLVVARYAIARVKSHWSGLKFHVRGWWQSAWQIQFYYETTAARAVARFRKQHADEIRTARRTIRKSDRVLARLARGLKTVDR